MKQKDILNTSKESKLKVYLNFCALLFLSSPDPTLRLCRKSYQLCRRHKDIRARPSLERLESSTFSLFMYRRKKPQEAARARDSRWLHICPCWEVQEGEGQAYKRAKGKQNHKLGEPAFALICFGVFSLMLTYRQNPLGCPRGILPDTNWL